MPEAQIIDEVREGGCQCGRVRFRTSMRPVNVHFCHCRMCQRAAGNVFAALAGVRRDRMEWVRGEPAVFESSTAAERGFCRDCGTPLFFRYKTSAFISLAIGAFDDPGTVRLERHYGVESRVPWLVIADGRRSR